MEIHADCLPTGNCGQEYPSTALQTRGRPSADRTVLEDPQKIFARMTALNGQLEFEYQPEVRYHCTRYIIATIIDCYSYRSLMFLESTDSNRHTRWRFGCAVQHHLDEGGRLGPYPHSFSTPPS